MRHRLLLLTTILLILSAPIPVHAALDSTLFTTYVLSADHTRATWTVCGSLPGTSGCYGSGSIGPLGKIAAMLEGNPSVNLANGTVTRSVYVLDQEYGADKKGVALNVYKKVDTISSGDDTVTMSLFKTVVLPLTGGSTAVLSLAANSKFLYVGSNQTELAVQVKKGNFAVAQFSFISGPLTVSSITTDKYGFVTVTWGSSSGPGGFGVIGPNGNAREDGGGVPFMLNTNQAILPSSLP